MNELVRTVPTMLAIAAATSFLSCSSAMPSAQNVTITGGTSTQLVETVRREILTHAPYKQWDLATGTPNLGIGRTPGAACEAVSFLVKDWRVNRVPGSLAKARELADWVAALQAADEALPIPGGVPSTPDLAAPASDYRYSIDAAFCGMSMLDLNNAVPNAKWRRSASGFGRFLLAMMRGGSGLPAGHGDRGLCESVIQTREGVAWNCRRYVKNLIALPFLAQLDRIQKTRSYAKAAAEVRATLVPGLTGFWEYADGPVTTPTWHRVEGPHREPNRFVFGDTLAYALKGLVAYEGVSPVTQSIYREIVSSQGNSGRTQAYDPRIALAGYIIGGERAADPLSAYYDLVTLGLLYDVRLAIAPDDAATARAVLLRNVAPLHAIGWHMDMSRTVSTKGMADVSTLAALGQAALVAN